MQDSRRGSSRVGGESSSDRRQGSTEESDAGFPRGTRRSQMTQLLSDAAAGTSPMPIAPTHAGLRVPRRYTRPGVNPLDQITWEKRRTVIANPDGSGVPWMDDVEVPAEWSQLATDLVVSKYFRKAGVPGPVGHETSVRQVVHRLAHTIRTWGEAEGGYFAGAEDADAFEAELSHMLALQIGAFNSPVWFNC